MQTHQSPVSDYKHAGFTLLELVIIMAIVAMLSAFAAPTYTSLVVNQHKMTAMAAFQHSVHLARTESNKSLEYIVICPSQDGLNCTQNTKNFSYGWITFINNDKDSPSVRDSDEKLIHSIKLDESDFDLVSNRKVFTFRPTTKRNTNGTVMFCPHHIASKNQSYQAVIISYTGRPRVDNQPKDSHLKLCDLT